MPVNKNSVYNSEEKRLKKLKKIVLIGPVYPYKGGISHYTTMLYRALEEKYNVTMVSFKLQYPKFLFKKEQKDYSNKSFQIDGTNYWINTANPLNWTACAEKISRIHPDLIIMEWWHPYFAPCYKIMNLFLKKINVLFLCHNVFPHERFPLDRMLTRLTLKCGDGFIVQSTQDGDDLCSIMRHPVYRKTVHPTYNVFKQEDLSKAEGRKRLGLRDGAPVLLFFGFVRAYKGLRHLIHAMPAVCREYPDAEVLIVGEFSGDKEQYLKLIEDHKLDGNVKIYDGYIPDREVGKFFVACDLVVLPYESATQSGIVQIAYGFEKPVIVTNVGGLPEVVSDGRTGYVVEPRNPEELAEKIIQYFKEGMESAFRENIEQEAYRYSWERMVEVIEELYRDMENDGLQSITVDR